jgi:serine/threonine protein kinase
METPAVAEVAHMIEIEIKKLEAGKRFGYYEIIKQIGAGGMGEVYRARDEKLNRDVAIKVLPASLSENHDRLSRFEQEAQAAGALNHPNILTIHEIGEVDGCRFIATEFIEGQTLRERLRSGVELDDALDIAIQVASALVAAHRVNIIHRDIKPENIMIRRDDGLVKVLDFGLAKMSVPQRLLDSEAETQVRANTAPGVLMGTVAYMSPEQARGDTVDARTDIWSLGAVLYELIAGCSPFLAATSSEIISGILSKTAPSPLARYSRHVPDRLEEIVEKALSKNRDERYQTSKDLLIDLKRLKQSLQLKAGIERSTSAEANDGGQVKAVGRDSAVVSTGAAAAGPATFATGKPISSAEYLLNQVKRSKLGAVVVLASLVVIVVLGIYFIFFNHRSTLTEKDTILLESNAHRLDRQFRSQLRDNTRSRQRADRRNYRQPANRS